jgi:purine-binding chemotaxis protein CheW
MHDESKVGKFIVFKVTNYLLALPINDVLKVLNCSNLANKGLLTMGVVQLGRHMIRVLNLQEQLGVKLPYSPGSLPELPGEFPFLVITHGQDGQFCGIPVHEPPNLVELSLEMMRSLPLSERQSGVFKMVSHVATLPDNTTTIFLLDVKRVLNTAMNDSALCP